MSSYLYALDTDNKRPVPVKVDSDGNLQVDVVSMTGGGDATAAKQDASKTVLDNILSKNTEVKTAVDNLISQYVQSTLVDDAMIDAGSDTNEIDMGSNPHLTIFGTTDTNYGNFCLVRKSGSAGSKILDPQGLFSASEVESSSGVYSYAMTYENIGTRYVAIKNMNASSQTITMFAVLHR